MLVVERNSEALDFGLARREILDRGSRNRIGPGQLAAGAGACRVGVLDRRQAAERGPQRRSGRRNQMHIVKVEVAETDGAGISEITGGRDLLGDRTDEILRGDDRRVVAPIQIDCAIGELQRFDVFEPVGAVGRTVAYVDDSEVGIVVVAPVSPGRDNEAVIVEVAAESRYVITLAAVELVVARFAREHVIAVAALEFVIAGSAVKRVVALAAFELVVAVVTVENVVAVAALEFVITGAAVERVVALATFELVVARVAREEVVAVATFDLVIAGPAVERVVALTAFELVVAAVTVEGVVAVAALEFVITGSAVERVITLAAVEIVVAAVAVENVVAVLAHDPVVAGSAVDRVVASTAQDNVVARRTSQDVVAIRSPDQTTPTVVMIIVRVVVAVVVGRVVVVDTHKASRIASATKRPPVALTESTSSRAAGRKSATITSFWWKVMR